MILGLTLAFAMLGAPPAGLPSVDVQLPHPATGLPALERALRWFSLVEPSLVPERIRAAASELGVDPMDVAELTEMGLRTDRPMRVYLDPSTRAMTVEVVVRDRKRVLAHLADIMTKNKERPEVARWGDAVLIDTGATYLVAVVLDKDRLYIQLPEAPRLSFFGDSSARMRLPAAKKTPKRWTDHARLAPLAALKKRKKFSAPKLDLSRVPDLYFRSVAGDDSAAGALVANSNGFELYALWALSARDQVVMGEIVSAKHKARSLFDEGPLKPALSVRARLMSSGARLLVERLGVPAQLTQGVEGGVHAVVTASGEFVLELEVSEKIGEPARALLEQALKARVSTAKVVLDSEAKRLGVYVGAVDPAGLRKLGEEEAAPLVLDLRPEHVLSVLGGVRDRYGPRYTLNNVELMAARMVVEPVVRATESVHLEVMPRGAALSVRADIRYRE